MDCSQIRKKLCEYIDREVDSECCREIENHLRVCPSCEAEYAEMREIVSICREKKSITMPEGLKEKIMENIKKFNCNKE